MTITKEQIEAARKAAPVHLGPALDSTIRDALLSGGMEDLQAENERLRTDAGVLLAQLDAVQEIAGCHLDCEDRALVEAIRITLKGSDA